VRDEREAGMSNLQTGEKLPDQSWKATEEPATFEELETFLVDEIFKNSGLNPYGPLRKVAGRIFSPFIRRFVQTASIFDQEVSKIGLIQSARKKMESWTPGIVAEGVDHIPLKGPFVVATNHPGTFDSLSVIANLPRDDFKVIVSANPFFRILPNTREWFIFTTRDPHVRMATMRRAIRFLKDGGLLVIFPSGKLEPDPAYYPQDALDALSWWSNSPGVFCRRIPDSGVGVAINSAVNDIRYINHPLGKLRRSNYDRQKVAEFLQVVDLMIRDKTVLTRPRITFSEPKWMKDLGGDEDQLFQWMLQQAGEIIRGF